MKRARTAEDAAMASIETLSGFIQALQDRVRQLFSPILPETMFDMQTSGGRDEMIGWLWAGNYSSCNNDLLNANEQLESDLQAWTTSNYVHADNDMQHKEQRRVRLNFLANLIARIRNMHLMPAEHVLLGLEAKHTMVHTRFWDKLTSRRLLPSRRWIDDVVTDALESNPGCPYEVVDWCSAAVADNYTEECNYKAKHTQDSQGLQLNMTNWASLALARSSVPHEILSALDSDDALKNMFKPGFDKFDVVALCHPHHPEIRTNQTNRWRAAFDGIQAGTYFCRPDFTPDIAHHLHYHPPIRDRLQSSYEDVEFELEVMRSHPRHKYHKFMFVGGDGLLINRLNHSLARNPSKWIRRAPAVIPVQGEHPHGTCHVLHMGWRPYAPMMTEVLRNIGHMECGDDFKVSQFNMYEFATLILIEGIAKYFIHLENGGGMPRLRSPGRLMQASSGNIDLQWLLHFLHDYGFLYWQLRQAVRANKSAEIDLVWRECVSFMHTGESHKTQYAPMAIMRIFWSNALCDPLAALYHANRTISLTGMPGSNVGWDMPIEKENLMISNNVTRPNMERIDKYVAELNFLGPVSRGVEKLLAANRNIKAHALKNIQSDVQLVTDYLIQTLGGTWAEANVPRPQNESLIVNPQMSPLPWASVEGLAGSADFDKWIRNHIITKVPWM